MAEASWPRSCSLRKLFLRYKEKKEGGEKGYG